MPLHKFHSPAFKGCSDVSVNQPPARLKTRVSSASWHPSLCHSYTRTLSLDEILILGEFLSGPRAARGTQPGKGVTFLGVKFNYPAGERVCCEWWANGCPFPACDKEVKNHRKASIIPSENGPCGWLHGLHSHSLPSTTAPGEGLKLSFSFLPSPLSSSQKRAFTMWLEGWSGFSSTPVDSAHVDNIHRMSVH